MGALPREKAGVGSAINDTGREVGGTLGVAVSGSIFATVYAPRIAEFLLPLGVDEDVADIAGESVGAAFAVAEQAGSPEAADAIRRLASSAFMDGFQAACTTVSVVALVGAVLAWRFLPDRVRVEAAV
jgi:hypothetical protein